LSAPRAEPIFDGDPGGRLAVEIGRAGWRAGVEETMRNGERGEGRIGFIITLALFLVGVFLAVKIVPVRVDGYQFREVLREEARFAAVNRNDKAVVARILDSAEAMNIPLEKGDLSIRRTKVEVIISATYEKPVDLKVGTYTYRFNTQQKAPLF